VHHRLEDLARLAHVPRLVLASPTRGAHAITGTFVPLLHRARTSSDGTPLQDPRAAIAVTASGQPGLPSIARSAL
jgi:hypothetical protein